MPMPLFWSVYMALIIISAALLTAAITINF